MANTENLPIPTELKGHEKTIFRFFFLYFLVQILPLDAGFWQHLFSTNWLQFGYSDIFYLSRYQPQFLPGGPGFINWAIIALIAGIGTLIWAKRDHSLLHYQQLYYWLRVLLRYRLALALIAYGFIKFFPLQAPPPSISHLNTNYGDFSTWKLFSLSLGVVPDYQSFLGLVELTGALLLLHRKTATIATLIIIPFTGNVFFSNLAYEGGEYVYSFYLITIALYLFAFDGIRLFNLFSLERPTAPNFFRPVFTEKWQQTARLALKSAFILLFVGLYGFQTYNGYRKGQYHYPASSGLTGTEGLYLVSSFRSNNQDIPFSKTDPNRWQDVVFEKWNTLSIQSNRPVVLTKPNTEEIYQNDADRNYEYTGVQGRHYYSYEADTDKQLLRLKNRNPQHPEDTLVLHYSRPDTATIVLSGVDAGRDSVYAVLQKVDKKYLIFEAKKAGRRRGLKL